MEWRDRIETKSEVLAGEPVVAGTRIPVELVVELLAQDWTADEILEHYPALSRKDVQACLRYANEMLQSERVLEKRDGLLVSTAEVPSDADVQSVIDAVRATRSRTIAGDDADADRGPDG
jgi:uncharacterized protein (DUF433 family)